MKKGEEEEAMRKEGRKRNRRVEKDEEKVEDGEGEEGRNWR